MTRPVTPDRDRLRFRYELLHARGREAIWPDATGTIESVVVAPYDFWPEALLVTRDGERLRVPAQRAEALDQQGRLLLESLSEPSTAAAAPARQARRRPRARRRRLEPARHGGSRRER